MASRRAFPLEFDGRNAQCSAHACSGRVSIEKQLQFEPICRDAIIVLPSFAVRTECHGYKIIGRLPADAILLELNATVMGSLSLGAQTYNSKLTTSSKARRDRLGHAIAFLLCLSGLRAFILTKQVNQAQWSHNVRNDAGRLVPPSKI